jgi:hypothetical protein
MHVNKQFSKNYFEGTFPKLRGLVDRYGKPPCVILTLDEGERVELKDFYLTSTRLVLKNSSGYYSIPFHTIRSIQFVPQERKPLALAVPKPALNTEEVRFGLS